MKLSNTIEKEIKIIVLEQDSCQNFHKFRVLELRHLLN
jgi:hypothetical protein